MRDVPMQWLRVLFQRSAWPESWALYLDEGTWTPAVREIGMRMRFAWLGGDLRGVDVNAFSVHSLFGLMPPDGPAASRLQMRPKVLTFGVTEKSTNPQTNPDRNPSSFAIVWP